MYIAVKEAMKNDALKPGLDPLNQRLFGVHATLGSLTLRGISEPWAPIVYFDGANVGAWIMNTIRFNRPPTGATGVFQCHELGRMTNPPLPGGGFAVEFV